MSDGSGVAVRGPPGRPCSAAALRLWQPVSALAEATATLEFTIGDICSPLRAARARPFQDHSRTVSGLVITMVVLIAPWKVSHIRAVLLRPCRVTMTVLNSPSGVRPQTS
jgi:hypothetical protein